MHWLRYLETYWLLLFLELSSEYRPTNAVVHRFPPGSTDKEILDHLLKKSAYDGRLRPGLPKSPTIVDVGVTVLSLSSPDESSLKYEVEFVLHQYWYDERLEFDDSGLHEYLRAINHQDDMWLPDTYFIKHGDFKDPLLPNIIELRVYNNGTVKFSKKKHLVLTCEGNLSIFPFDDPCCTFAVESVSYEKSHLKYQWKAGQRLSKMEPFHTLNAYLVSNKTMICDNPTWRGSFSCLRVELKFTRDKSFYFSTVFIPGMLVVTSSFISFWLEWNSVPGRVSLGVTTMLNFFTMSNHFRSSLPVVSNLTAMNVWDGVCMCFIYASLLEFVTVNYLARKKPRIILMTTPPNSRVTATTVPVGHEDNGNEDMVSSSSYPRENNTPSHAHTRNSDAMRLLGWKFPPPIRIAKMIDVVSRVFFPVTYGIFLLFFFICYRGFASAHE